MRKLRFVNYIKNILSTLTVMVLLLVALGKFDYGIRGISIRLLLYVAFIIFFLLVFLNLHFILSKLSILIKGVKKTTIFVVKTGNQLSKKLTIVEKKDEVHQKKRTIKLEESLRIKRTRDYFSSFFYNIWRKKVIKYILIPSVLFLLGVKLTFLSMGLNSERFNVVVQNLGWNSLSYLKASELMSGEIISGEFAAKNDNLGTVAIRFDTLNRINNDTLRFRIKEKGSTQWYYSNDYQTKVFSPEQLFPFGFPKIGDSAGRIFQWEIESASGKEGNAIKLSKLEPVLQIKYEFVQRELIKTPKAFIIFSIKRFGDIINSEYLPLLVIYFSPLFVYLIGIVFSSGISAHDLILALLFFLVVANISGVGPGNDYVFGTISILWLVINFIFGFKGKLSVILGLIFLLLTAIFLSVGNELLSERIAIWAYLFLLAGVILISCEKTSEEHVETK